MIGPEVLQRTLSVRRKFPANGKPRGPKDFPLDLNYHSQSDHHSKTACWGIVVDLLSTCQLMQTHAAAGKIAFGINHKIIDFQQNNEKDLDLVVCTPGGPSKTRKPIDLLWGIQKWGLQLSAQDLATVQALPPIFVRPVGQLLMALEAKACMTAHVKSAPRFYDELNSSHQVVHGNTTDALAVGLGMVNISEEFLSPKSNTHLPHLPPGTTPVISHHRQPRDVQVIIDKFAQLPRRANSAGVGFDGLAMLVVDCDNNGGPFTVRQAPPAPQPNTAFHYEQMIHRVAGEYATRFARI